MGWFEQITTGVADASRTLPVWTPTTIPTRTTFSSVDPTNANGLWETVLSASAVAMTATETPVLYGVSKVLRGAAASLTILEAEKYLATANPTETASISMAKEMMFNATLNLKALEWDLNLYTNALSIPANALFASLFGLLFVLYCAWMFSGKQIYFGVCLACGTVLEFCGYFARALAAKDYADPNKYLCQIVCLTMAPAFVMAGIYYILGQLKIVYGSYGILPAKWYTFMFILCDVVSLLTQAVGGAIAAIQVRQYIFDPLGTNIMIAGIALQLCSMTLFVIFWTDMLFKASFRADPNFTFTFGRFFHLLFNTSRGRHYRDQLEPYYSPEYTTVRHNRLFGYLPLTVSLAVLFVYVRCAYRVAELSQGWTGFLITHEPFIMTLDALMVFLACVMFVPMYPSRVFGDAISWKVMKQATQLQSSEKAVHDGKSLHSNDTKTTMERDRKNFHLHEVASGSDSSTAYDRDNESFYF